MVVLVNYPFDPEIRDPQDLLVRYGTLSGWARALVNAADTPVTVVQRFWRDVELRSDGVLYRFVCDGAGPSVPAWHWSDRAARTARQLQPSIVHFNGLVFPVAVRIFRRHVSRATPILVQDHGGIHDGSAGFRDWRWRALHRIGLASASGFLFAARSQADPWIRSGVIAAAQPIYEVLEASSDLFLSGSATSGKGQLPGNPAILWVGRLNQNKDPLTILEGLERALPDAPGAELTMVFGTEDIIGDVRRRVEHSASLAGRVHLLGRVEHTALAALYDSADLFVLGSHHEGGAYALIEAIGFGLTPVVSDIPVFRAIIQDTRQGGNGGTIGSLFPVGDAESLARAIVRLAGMDLRARRPSVRDHFTRTLSWEAIARRALVVYRQAVDRGRALPGA